MFRWRSQRYYKNYTCFRTTKNLFSKVFLENDSDFLCFKACMIVDSFCFFSKKSQLWIASNLFLIIQLAAHFWNIYRAHILFILLWNFELLHIIISIFQDFYRLVFFSPNPNLCSIVLLFCPLCLIVSRVIWLMKA